MFVSNFGTVKKVRLFVNLSYGTWIQRAPIQTKYLLKEEVGKKIGTNLRGIWRREDLKEITMRHFPEKQMALHNFYKNLLQHSTIFFVKSFQQVWMKQRQDFSERKAWKKNFFERKLYNICLPTLFSILKNRKTQIIAKNTCEFLVWYPSVSKLFVHVFFFVKKWNNFQRLF